MLCLLTLCLVPVEPVLYLKAFGSHHDYVCMVQATEDFLVHLFEDCNLCAIHAKRVTISTPLTPAILPLR